MGRRNQYNAKQFITAIPGTGGIISTIAKRVGCDWDTAKKYVTEYPSISRAYINECESILDMGETSLYQSVRDREAWAVKYLLSTKGKKRGYVERQEIKQEGETSVTIRWRDAKDS